jgi:thioredoxin-dependent peroxiredoxin
VTVEGVQIRPAIRRTVIAVGEVAPPFVGVTGDGTRLDLATYRGKPIILYFYPKANTTGCTMEARGFAEHFPELRRAGIEVVGVSVDSVAQQKSFAERCKLPFPLVADEDKTIAKRYGVLGFLGIAKRVTFFIDPDGTVAEVLQGLVPGPHVRRAVERAEAALRMNGSA